ncbi:hypothetical protein A9G45_00365 [Gilliamella sp. HK2]|jgi:hypothetical protein|uniref:hypothetical protein n=1 Tax=unclassified Gilliamella TaxID=2685620 RepID=UPI00080E43F5|nr:hypothetical protein [Gilliamella apicola]OCG26540.1 hypothetical protein A9G45_00365 [Gilliamella apicola]OCG26975.1 hypothetical protein A9G46_03895 [Gilliamella apicola]
MKKTVVIKFTIPVKLKGKWSQDAKRNNLTLTNWIINKLNSDIKFDCDQEVLSHNDIPPSQRYFIKVSVPTEYKGYWVYASRLRGKKLRVWIINKLNHGVI